MDPVTQDLNRHIAQMEKSEARAEAEEAKVEEMMKDQASVKDIIEQMMCDESIDMAGDVASVVASNSPDEALSFFRRLRTTIAKEAERLASDILDREDAEAEEAKAGDLIEAQEDRHGH